MIVGASDKVPSCSILSTKYRLESNTASTELVAGLYGHNANSSPNGHIHTNKRIFKIKNNKY